MSFYLSPGSLVTGNRSASELPTEGRLDLKGRVRAECLIKSEPHSRRPVFLGCFSLHPFLPCFASADQLPLLWYTCYKNSYSTFVIHPTSQANCSNNEQFLYQVHNLIQQSHCSAQLTSESATTPGPVRTGYGTWRGGKRLGRGFHIMDIEQPRLGRMQCPRKRSGPLPGGWEADPRCVCT